MNKYTIYCTPEQTKKALELGAPIAINAISDEPMCIYTAEQMIGWLEEQNFTFRIYEKFTSSWHYFVGYKKYRETVKDFDNVDSRKEATLAAIDTALEYLTNNKK